jgi:hypothetical protein
MIGFTPVRGRVVVNPFIPFPAAIAIRAAQGVRAVVTVVVATG